MKYLRKLFVVVIALSLVMQCSLVTAHSGRTDSSGGHHDYKNASGLGSYHYHHGEGPHLHPNGVCPYSSTSSSSSSTTSSLTATQKQNKKYQKMLNKIGYNCGKADGVLGTKSKKAIKKFQKDYKLSKTGKLNTKTKQKITKIYNLG